MERISTIKQFMSVLQDQSAEFKLIVFGVFWSQTCVEFENEMEIMSKGFRNVKFYKIDADEMGELAKYYKADEMPSVVVFQNDEVAKVMRKTKVESVKDALKLLD